MIGLLQRVSSANIQVDGSTICQIGQGILLFLGVERGDKKSTAERLLDKVLAYRIFADESDKMNRSLMDIEGELLVVPQFTLAADTKCGLRPGFSTAAAPQTGLELCDYFVSRAQLKFDLVQYGEFGANMQVFLINDGPVTFWLQVTPD